MFIVLLTSIFDTSNHTKCICLSNQKCEIQPTLINLHPNEYSQKLHYYPFPIKLDKCVRSCNTHSDLSNKVFVPNKRENLNIHGFNMITGKGESKLLAKVCTCKCTCKFDRGKGNLNQKWINDKC